MPDSLLLRCPWTLLHSWTFESETFEGLTPSDGSWELSFIDDPVVGKALQIYLRYYDLGGSFTASLDTPLYAGIAKACKIEFWYWTDDAVNGWYRPSVAVKLGTGAVGGAEFSDLYNSTIMGGIRRSGGTWYRVVGMVWVEENRFDAFVYNAAGALLGHSSGTYAVPGIPITLTITAIRAHVISNRETIRFSNVSISYTPALPPDPATLRRRRAAWQDFERLPF